MSPLTSKSIISPDFISMVRKTLSWKSDWTGVYKEEDEEVDSLLEEVDPAFLPEGLPAVTETAGLFSTPWKTEVVVDNGLEELEEVAEVVAGAVVARLPLPSSVPWLPKLGAEEDDALIPWRAHRLIINFFLRSKVGRICLTS